MISSFGNKETEIVFQGFKSRQLPSEIQNVARRKLVYLHEAKDIRDLLSPPGNRLEKLSGDRAGKYSIRVNDQWRICFRWFEKTNEATEVVVEDYH